MHVAVVGSGPAGLSCANALLLRGYRVTILDVAEQLDAPIKKIVDDLRGTDPAQWSRKVMDVLRANPTLATGGIPKKFYFGSDFVYAADRPYAPLDVTGTSAVPTNAQGGYSTVWGAALLPTADCDLTGWPLTRKDLAPYYADILAEMPLCAGDDPLLTEFPLFKEHPGNLDPGIQGNRLLDDLLRAGSTLARRGTLFGRPRLAVHVTDAGAESLGCVYCGLCLSGCPRGSIYSTVPQLESLVRRGAINYLPGVHVEHVAERDDQTIVSFTRTATGERIEQAYDAVFVGAGPINTTRILLASRNMLDQPVTLLESQKFLIPVLRLNDSPGALEDRNVTLASAFLETKIPDISDHWIHVQLSAVNEMVLRSLGMDSERPSLRKLMLGPALRRLMVAWCGLHSDHSSRLVLTLRSGMRNGRHELAIHGELSAAAKQISKRVAKSLFSLGWSFRSAFLFPLIRFSDPGTGTHCGGAFPMSLAPRGELESDLFGRPFGWTRIFAIDSTIFPSIPGTTIALTVMANARRIGATAPVRELARA